MSAAIILFARAPQPGRAKTRLVPPLTPASAATLHTAFVEDIVRRFQTLAGITVELHTDNNTDAWPALDVARKVQITGGLELKLFHAIRNGLNRGFDRIAVVGTDSPTLPLGHARQLLESAADVCLGPAEDGGFWGISANRTKPSMLAEIQWSQPDTLQQTIRAIRRTGLTVELGPSWYDVDTPTDLDRLLSEPELPPSTAAWVSDYRKSSR